MATRAWRNVQPRLCSRCRERGVRGGRQARLCWACALEASLARSYKEGAPPIAVIAQRRALDGDGWSTIGRDFGDPRGERTRLVAEREMALYYERRIGHVATPARQFRNRLAGLVLRTGGTDVDEALEEFLRLHARHALTEPPVAPPSTHAQVFDAARPGEYEAAMAEAAHIVEEQLRAEGVDVQLAVSKEEGGRGEAP